MYLGWDKDRRVQMTALHLRIKDGKIWVEVDKTEEGFANVLMRKAVCHAMTSCWLFNRRSNAPAL